MKRGPHTETFTLPVFLCVGASSSRGLRMVKLPLATQVYRNVHWSAMSMSMDDRYIIRASNNGNTEIDFVDASDIAMNPLAVRHAAEQLIDRTLAIEAIEKCI